MMKNEDMKWPRSRGNGVATEVYVHVVTEDKGAKAKVAKRTAHIGFLKLGEFWASEDGSCKLLQVPDRRLIVVRRLGVLT